MKNLLLIPKVLSACFLHKSAQNFSTVLCQTVLYGTIQMKKHKLSRGLFFFKSDGTYVEMQLKHDLYHLPKMFFLVKSLTLKYRYYLHTSTAGHSPHSFWKFTYCLIFPFTACNCYFYPIAFSNNQKIFFSRLNF